ncbi:MAG: S8 family serine peptidase [Ignavibacteria bacterium]|nr:S8 family serine peptidase [Ignavibacteria bacterium]
MIIKNLVAIAIISSIIAVSSAFAQEKYEASTVLKEKFTDKSGAPLTGKGVIIGDVDSGIDVFHPMFFFADGGEFTFVDVNGDGNLTVGEDGLDINGDGKIESSEVLRFQEIRDNTWGMLSSLGQVSGKYNPEFDFLYVDVNGNKKRDFGTKAGFKESDPSYGEQFFISIDENKNGKIEAGEKLVGLKTSKIRSVRQRDDIVRRRGIDLIDTEEDKNGHGTGVAGLIIGGHYGVQKIHGIAPDAEMVFSSIRYDYTPRFVRNFTDLVGFLRDEKVNILLFEDGEWMWEFMDGSSPEEEMVNQMARDGVTIVGGAGNMSGGNMVVIDQLKTGKSVTYTASCSGKPDEDVTKNDGVFFSFLWKDASSNIKFEVETPDGKSTGELSEGSGILKTGQYKIFYSREVSPKGTVMMKFGASTQDSDIVRGKFKIKLTSDKDQEIRGYVVDVTQSWSGNARWVNSNAITDESNICFPSTADSCMAIGAYVFNVGWMDQVGDLATYSSKGYNITGKLGVDLTGPGHSTFSTEKNNSYQIFSGTSSAAPHVVGTAALLLQYEPSLTHEKIRMILLNSARKDNFTGDVPNAEWGYGKLHMEGAIKYLMNLSN